MSGKVCVLTVVLGTVGCGHGLYVRPGVATAPSLPPEQTVFRLVLVGDAGSDVIARPEGWPLLDRLTEDLRAASRTAVVFLGDNVYPAGVPTTEHAPGADAARRILQAQLTAGAPADHVIFVPGNHDWNRGRPGGLGRIRAQGALIQRLGGTAGQARLLPPDGCPGPVTLDLDSVVRLVVIDTEWLLTDDDVDRKPVGTGTGCRYGDSEAPVAFDGALTRETFYRALEGELQSSALPVVLISHHPLRSRGPHGGYLGGSWLPYVWPLLLRLHPRRQDFASEINQEMRASLDAALQGVTAPLVIAVAGHEHNLQVFDDPSGVYYLVSGSGSKTSPAGRTAATMFKQGAHGYMRLDFLNDGRVFLVVVEPTTPDDTLRVQLHPRR